MDLKTLKSSDENVVILPGAMVNGDVSFGPGCSVWYNTVIRGDGGAPIIFGENCNIQDNSTIHNGWNPMVIGNGVTIGHNAIVHSCTIGDNTLIGMGAIILDDSVIGKDCLIAAGSLVAPRTVVPDGSMVVGSPAKVRRPLTPEEIEENRNVCRHYAELRERYR